MGMDLSVVTDLLFNSGLFEMIIYLVVFLIVVKLVLMIPQALDDIDM